MKNARERNIQILLRAKKINLSDLLEQITEENQHRVEFPEDSRKGEEER